MLTSLLFARFKQIDGTSPAALMALADDYDDGASDDGELDEHETGSEESLAAESEDLVDEESDEEEEAVSSATSVSTSEPPQQGSKKHRTKLYALPTHDEMQELHESELLFNSNIEKMQVCPSAFTSFRPSSFPFLLLLSFFSSIFSSLSLLSFSLTLVSLVYHSALSTHSLSPGFWICCISV